MPNLSIEPLAEHRDLIELTVDWHVGHFDPSGPRHLWLDARTHEAHHLTGVPCAWVAFVDSTPAGCVSLVECNMSTRPDLTPWLATLFVLPEHRGNGIGQP